MEEQEEEQMEALRLSHLLLEAMLHGGTQSGGYAFGQGASGVTGGGGGLYGGNAPSYSESRRWRTVVLAMLEEYHPLLIMELLILHPQQRHLTREMEQLLLPL